MFGHTMDKHTFPPGDRILAGKTSIIAQIDFERYMKMAMPTHILQCNFYNSISKQQKTVDLFHPNVDFGKYVNTYDLVACSVQKM